MVGEAVAGEGAGEEVIIFISIMTEADDFQIMQLSQVQDHGINHGGAIHEGCHMCELFYKGDCMGLYSMGVRMAILNRGDELAVITGCPVLNEDEIPDEGI